MTQLMHFKLQVRIAAKGVTENDRVGFGHFSYGLGWIWDDHEPIVPGWMLYAYAPSPRFRAFLQKAPNATRGETGRPFA
jgi:hypothetical protein